MKVFKLLLLSFSFVAIFFASCKKDDAATRASTPKDQLTGTNTLEIVAPNLKSENSVLVFKDLDDFNNTYLWMEKNSEKVDQLFFDLANFKSMRSAFYSIETDDFKDPSDLNQYSDIAFWKKSLEGTDIEMLIRSPFYSQLFNDKGLVKVGSQYIKVGIDQNWYFFDEKYIDEISTYRVLSDIPNVKKVNLSQLNGRNKQQDFMFCWTGSYHMRKANCYRVDGFILQQPNNIPIPTGVNTFEVYTKKRCIFGAWCNVCVQEISIKCPGFAASIVNNKDCNNVVVFNSTTTSSASANIIVTDACGTTNIDF
jgi:hypothetical protein